MKSWTIKIELSVSENWIEDGFDATERVGQIEAMMEELLPYSYPGEVKAVVTVEETPEVFEVEITRYPQVGFAVTQEGMRVYKGIFDTAEDAMSFCDEKGWAYLLKNEEGVSEAKVTPSDLGRWAVYGPDGWLVSDGFETEEEAQDYCEANGWAY